MSLASSASFRDAQEVGFFGYPDDGDAQPDVAARDDACGADSERLIWLGFNFDLCERKPGHAGFHHFLAL